MSKTLEQAKSDLKAFLLHAKLSVNMGKVSVPGAKIQFGIVAKKEDGSGMVVSSFECEEFLNDLEIIVGDPLKED